jgi:hypothetical protein
MSLQSIVEQLKTSYGRDFAKFEGRLREIDQSFKDAAKALEPFLADFKRFADHLRQIPSHLRGPLQDLARHGWYLDPSCSLDVPLSAHKILAAEGSAALDAALADYFDGQSISIVDELSARYPDRAQIIRAAHRAHSSQEFELSVPVFLIQADGISKEQFGRYLFIRSDGNPEISRYLDTLPQDDLLRAFMAPLAEPTTVNLSQRERGPIFVGLNRHLVIHGDSVDYGTRTNSLKALSLLNHVGRISSQVT